MTSTTSRTEEEEEAAPTMKESGRRAPHPQRGREGGRRNWFHVAGAGEPDGINIFNSKEEQHT